MQTFVSFCRHLLDTIRYETKRYICSALKAKFHYASCSGLAPNRFGARSWFELTFGLSCTLLAATYRSKGN